MGIEQAVIMGHSLGAFIGLAFGSEYSDRTDRLILVDGGGDLNQIQMSNVFTAIKPTLDRLGKVFPSAQDYLIKIKEASYIHPWTAAIETYYRYELEDVDGGVRTNINPTHIQEEADNLRKVDCVPFYFQIKC